MFRPNHMSSNMGSGGASSNTGFVSKIKGMFSRFSMTTILYLLAFLLFIIIAIYIYQSYVSPKLAPSYSSQDGSGSGSGSGKTAELMLFYVDWCPHCKTGKPIWDEVKNEYQHRLINGYKVLFKEYNCTEETAEVEQLMNQYHIEGYPTIKLLKDGQVIEFDAKPTKAALEQFLNTVL